MKINKVCPSCGYGVGVPLGLDDTATVTCGECGESCSLGRLLDEVPKRSLEQQLQQARRRIDDLANEAQVAVYRLEESRRQVDLLLKALDRQRLEVSNG